MICTPAYEVIVNDNNIIVKYNDGVCITITYDLSLFSGWLTPLSIPEYFKLGVPYEYFNLKNSKKLHAVILPNGYEDQLYNYYEYAKKYNNNIIPSFTC